MLGTIVFAGGILLALPAITALLMINIAFGIVADGASAQYFRSWFPGHHFVGSLDHVHCVTWFY